MLCEAAVLEPDPRSDGYIMRSCGQPAVKIMKLTEGPQAGTEHPACRFHFEEMAKDFPDCFEIVKDFDNVA